MAFPATIFWLFFLVTITFEAALAQPKESNMIKLGSSLYPNTQPTAWFSPSKRFAFGFFPNREGYKVEIRIVGSTNNITVWTFKRDEPAVSSNATIHFVDGKLLLKPDRQGQVQTIADHPSNSAVFASMLDSGNFVLYDEHQVIVWQSFVFPTDTILGGQVLYNGKELISSLSPDDHSSGRFRLKMASAGNLLAYHVNEMDESSDVYWASDTVANNNNSQLILDNVTGTLSLIDPTDASLEQVLASSISHIRGNIYRATLGYDGNFKLYSHIFDATGVQTKMLTEWEAIDDLCDVKGLCGANSYCTRIGVEQRCMCIPGFNSTIKHLRGQRLGDGCERNFTGGCCINGKEVSSFSKMTAVNIVADDRPYFQELVGNQEECMKSCLEDCDCEAAIYSDSDLYCSRYVFPLKYLRDTAISQESSIAFIKMSDVTVDHQNDPKRKLPWVTILTLSLSFITYSCIVLTCFSIFIFKFQVLHYKKMLLKTRTTGLIKEFTLRTYTYNELKKATGGFKQQLGKGSFGAVHKGSFDKGKSFVAVKRLEKVVEEGEREFRAEMRTIGRTRHKNLVRLLGYCIDGSKRLLVYEFMVTGSLSDLLFKEKRHPSWKDRVQIALDIARGIHYLHEECDAPIIHCDIKPQNILLDEYWNAKISDFGLAKLLMPDQTRTDTGARGTRGYMAPEWNKNVPISVKVDVYSFGIVLLEIVCCRRNLQVNLTRPEATLLSAWAYQCFAANELDKLVHDEEIDKKAFHRMVTVALWCIQEEPPLRFPMKTVLRMLEGIVDIPIPPCPSGEYTF